MKKSERERVLVWEKRILLVAFYCGILASLLFLICFSTSYWVTVTFTEYEFRNDTDGRPVYYKTGHYHGLWRICRSEYRNFTDDQDEHSFFCRAMWFTVPDDMTEPTRRALEEQMLNFRRSTIAVGFICLILSGIANCFAFYSLGQLRYTYKRLAGILEFIAGASSWVTIEVFKQSVYFEKRNQHNIAPNSEIRFDWSFHLVWLVLILFVFDGLVLVICSRKRKGARARSMKEANENEPVHLGRF